jgi:uncharacterized protein (TIGR02145 family)
MSSNNFDTAYTENNQNNRYALLPTTDQTIYQTEKALGETPAPLSDFKAYYGAKLTLATIAGEYKTTITYSAVGAEVPEPVYPELIIVPNIASTIAPTSDGTNPGPQFSLVTTDPSLSFTGLSPNDVTIGNKPCQELTIASTGKSATCTGPTNNLSAGEKVVKVNGQITTATVTYNDTVYPTLQSLTATTCQNLPLRLTGSDSASIHRDARDSQLYYIARLADNKCWMLDNLKYRPNGDTAGTATSGFSAVQVVNTGTTNRLTQDGTATQAAPNLDAGKYIDPILGISYCRTSTDKSTYNITKCGLLYNYYTATAGTYRQQDFTTAGSSAPGSICPANWRLPSGQDDSSDFSVLDKAYGGTGSTHFDDLDVQNLWLYSGAFASVYTGYYESSFVNPGSWNHLWSSSAAGVSNAYNLRLYSNFVEPGRYNYGARLYGFGVRCVIGS